MRLRPLGVGAALALTGCAGTSPNLSTPQMQTPTLGGTGLAARSSSGGAASPAVNEAALPALEPVKTPDKTFVALPYLQLGTAPDKKGQTLALLWHAAEGADDWGVETRPASGGTWSRAAKPVGRTIHPEGGDPPVAPHVVFRVDLTGLTAGALFDYRVLKGETPVFAARARARRTGGEPYRFVVFGDCGAGSEPQKKVAYQIAAAKPDFVFVTGDIVYSRGRSSEYAARFWPVYNAENAGPDTGAPLLRSALTIAAPGNHDIANRDLEKNPDGLGYFYYWAQPLNGPNLPPGPTFSPAPTGPEAAQKAFFSAAGDHFPRMANFSFDYGNAHWTVLDSNGYVDWSLPALRTWLEKDLSGAKKATWRFVAFHHPPFQSAKSHFENQWMRALAPLFAKHDVSIVWAGHVHNYQRSQPLRFAPSGPAEKDGKVEGQFTLDSAFDGQKVTRARGVLYVVSGAGGASLYKDVAGEKLQPFTAKFYADTHSLTVVDVNGKKLSVKQLSDDGKEVDTFTLTK